MALPRSLDVGRMLLHLDVIGRTLDPDFDPNAAIRRHAADLMSPDAPQRGLHTLLPGS